MQNYKINKNPKTQQKFISKLHENPLDMNAVFQSQESSYTLANEIYDLKLLNECFYMGNV